MASIRGILNIQSLNELTSENQPRPWSHEERIAARRIDRRGARSLHGEGETSGRLAGPVGPTGAPEKRPGPQHAPRLIGDRTQASRLRTRHSRRSSSDLFRGLTP